MRIVLYSLNLIADNIFNSNCPRGECGGVKSFKSHNCHSKSLIDEVVRLGSSNSSSECLYSGTNNWIGSREGTYYIRW